MCDSAVSSILPPITNDPVLDAKEEKIEQEAKEMQVELGGEETLAAGEETSKAEGMDIADTGETAGEKNE